MYEIVGAWLRNPPIYTFEMSFTGTEKQAMRVVTPGNDFTRFRVAPVGHRASCLRSRPPLTKRLPSIHCICQHEGPMRLDKMQRCEAEHFSLPSYTDANISNLKCLSTVARYTSSGFTRCKAKQQETGPVIPFSSVYGIL